MMECRLFLLSGYMIVRGLNYSLKKIELFNKKYFFKERMIWEMGMGKKEAWS